MLLGFGTQIPQYRMLRICYYAKSFQIKKKVGGEWGGGAPPPPLRGDTGAYCGIF